MSYLIRVTDGQLAQMSVSDKKCFEIVRKLVDNQERDAVAIKAIRKAMKKIINAPSVSDIVTFTKIGRVKVIRILNEQEGVLWSSEPAYGKVGKPTKVYTRIKKSK